MYVTRCRLTLHDSVYYATREMGTLYETGQHFHNYALSYALFNGWHFLPNIEPLITVPYFCNSYRPTYQEDLSRLNEEGIYVSPAKPTQWDYLLITWKMAQITYHQKAERFGGKNYPANIGRSKELAPESEFEFFVFSKKALNFPRWIRLGKWMSKAEVSIIWQGDVKQKHGTYTANHPLNPLDIPVELSVFDLISMPPVSLVNNARLTGDYYEVEDIQLPANMQYTFPEATQ